MEIAEKAATITFTIDGNALTVPKGTTVYKAAKQMGIEIPIFCYQDRMPPFGACRMCLVEVEKMPKLQTSCTLEATEGMAVKTQTQIVKEGREMILELLLINHPLDCPICDKGGECPLQDNAYKYGPGKSRFVEEKRHFAKAIPLGPVLELDRERCIVCARCTRFGEIVAGDNALEFIERGFKTEVGTPGGGPADSKFIGNTIMICPVGALTSRVYRFKARPWDNESTQTTCTLCPVGCSMILDARDGEIMRTRSYENPAVNDIWLCDKGWFGYEFSSSPERLQTPLMRFNGKLEIASWDEALSFIIDKMKIARNSRKAAAFGGNTLTTEENYLLQKLMRNGLQSQNLDHRIGTPVLNLEEERFPPGMEMTIGECEELSFAVLFGIDLTEEFPVIWLRLKQALNKGAVVLFFGHYAPEIASHLATVVLHQPGQELAFLKEYAPHIKNLSGSGKKGAFFVGQQYLASSQRGKILTEISRLQKDIPATCLNVMEGHDNSMGARLAGMLPDRGPLDEQVQEKGLNAVEVLEHAQRGGWDFLYVVGADPAGQYPAKLWQEARNKTGCLVVQDQFLTETAREADVVLPSLNFMEKAGSFINIEGRVQKLRPGKAIPKGVHSDAAIFSMLAHRLSLTLEFDSYFSEELKQTRIPLKRLEQKDKNTPAKAIALEKGHLFATFAPQLFDQGTRMLHNPHLIQMAKEPRARLNPKTAQSLNIKSDDKVQITSNLAAITAKALLDEGVAMETIVLPLGFTDLPVHLLGVNLLNGFQVKVNKFEAT